jgi:hypothetical protein
MVGRGHADRILRGRDFDAGGEDTYEEETIGPMAWRFELNRLTR